MINKLISEEIIHFSAYLINYFRHIDKIEIADMIAEKTISYVGKEEFEEFERDAFDNVFKNKGENNAI